jgi:hypothetical protein
MQDTIDKYTHMTSRAELADDSLLWSLLVTKDNDLPDSSQNEIMQS